MGLWFLREVDIGDHDSYVIFQPEKVRVIEETSLS